MQSFFRFIVVLVLIVTAYVGGWYSSTLIQQDPFLANIFPFNDEAYSRFLRDLASMIEEWRVQDQSQLLDTFVDLQDDRLAAIVGQLLGKNIDDFSADDESQKSSGELVADFTDINSTSLSSTKSLLFNPTEFVSTIVHRMTAREKLTFLVWARSRFTTEQLQQMEALLSKEITPDSIFQLYQLARPILNGKDVEYLLTFVDRYIETLAPANTPIPPSYRADEGQTVDHYISGN